MTILRPTRLSTEQFHFNPMDTKFIAEVSDFGPGFQFGQVYDDACDEGFTLVSKRTGKECVFAVEKTLTDNEGELHGWEFKCVFPREFKHFTAIVFND